MLPKPQVTTQPKDHKTKPDPDDKKNYHFMYICIKEIETIVDSSDDEATKKLKKMEAEAEAEAEGEGEGEAEVEEQKE